MQVTTRIGLEIHVQLTEAGTKLFCGCRSNYRGLEPNTNVCPVCLGLPGALPVPSRRAVLLGLAAAMALECRVPDAIVFTRKHYFYPDLPKNYQITQYEKVGGAPVCMGGRLKYLDPDVWEWRSIGITRINLEEDPGRAMYGEEGILASRYAFIDYNRSGVPLLEIVTEPNVRSPRDARLLVEYLLLTLEYIGAVNPRLEGAFRVDANISMDGGERVEIKNIGSTYDIEKALAYEEMRQKRLLESGGTVKRETRHWDSVKGVTRPMRHKEEEEEYLYFPDPDLPPVIVTRGMLEEAQRMSSVRPDRLLKEITGMNVKRELAWSIVTSRPATKLFLEVVKSGGDPIITARLLGIDYKGELREQRKDPGDPDNWPEPHVIARLVSLIKDGEYPYDAIKGLVLPRIAENPATPLDYVLPSKVLDPERLVEDVIKSETRAVRDYLSGKKQALNYLVGAAMRRARGRAVDPRILRRILLEKLEALRD